MYYILRSLLYSALTWSAYSCLQRMSDTLVLSLETSFVILYEWPSRNCKDEACNYQNKLKSQGSADAGAFTVHVSLHQEKSSSIICTEM